MDVDTSRSSPCTHSPRKASPGFAGLNTSPTEQNLGGTAAIITPAPNELMAPIHKSNARDPAACAVRTVAGSENDDPAEALTLLTPYPADAVMVTAVSTR
jgi:putative SOS response-associated peptidase YedK